MPTSKAHAVAVVVVAAMAFTVAPGWSMAYVKKTGVHETSFTQDSLNRRPPRCVIHILRRKTEDIRIYAQSW